MFAAYSLPSSSQVALKVSLRVFPPVVSHHLEPSSLHPGLVFPIWFLRFNLQVATHLLRSAQLFPLCWISEGLRASLDQVG